MNSIKKITLENFQSHKKTVIEPSGPGELTVIVGPSDSGKSAVLRGLRWLLYNEPNGNDFIRVGADFARVTLEFESGDVVARHRSRGGTNRYVVNGTIFEGFGTGVPLEVQDVTGVSTVQIGDISLNLNLAEQLDGPFLGKSISAGVRAKVLGKLAGTEEIDLAGKSVGTDLYRRNQDEKRLSAELGTLETNIAEYDYLPGLSNRIDQLEQLVHKLKNLRVKFDRLTTLKAALEVLNEREVEAQAIIEKWKWLELATNTLEKIEKGRSKLERLISSKAILTAAEKAQKDSLVILEKWKWLDLAINTLVEAERRVIQKDRLFRIKARIISSSQAILVSGETLKGLQGIELAEKHLVKAIQLKSTATSLIANSLKLTAMNEAISAQQKIIDHKSCINNAMEHIQEAGEVAARRNALSNWGTRLKQVEAEEARTRQAVVMMENRVAELEGAYQDQLTSLGWCPLCGGQVVPEKMKEVV